MFRVVFSLFLFRFFIMSSPIVGMFSVFMLESGLTPLGIAMVFASFMVAMNLFEVPSSVIADKYSRKMVIIVAIFILMISNIIFLFNQEQWAFILHMIIAGVGVALFSGTVEALLYDELKAIKKEKLYQKAYSFYHIAFSLGLCASLFLSAFLVKYGYFIIVVWSLFSCFVSLLVFIFGIKETKRVKEIDAPHSFREIFLEGRKTVLYNKSVLYLGLLSLLFGAINCVFGDVAIITSMENGWKKEDIARVFGFNTIFEAIMTFIFAKYVSKISVKFVHFSLIGTLVLALFGMIFGQKWSIFLVFPLWWGDRLKNMVVDAKIQYHVKSSSRATVTSCISMIFGMNYTITMLFLGMIATFYSFSLGFIIISFVGILQLIALFLFQKERN